MRLNNLFLLAVGASAHIMLSNPAPLRSKLNTFTNPSHIDYSMTSPLSPSGADFPCKGYHTLLNTPEGSAVATWTAGSTQQLTLAGSAIHGGGSCQASLSLDGGKTFRVLHSYVGGCPGSQGETLAFHLPGDVPSAEAALFAWTWFNNLGNREMYMNCAVVRVVGSGGGGQRYRPLAHGHADGNMNMTTTSGNRTGRYIFANKLVRGEGMAFANRPEIFKANIGNGCRTVDSKNVLFPNPGPDVTVVDGNAVPASGACQAGVGGGAVSSGSAPSTSGSGQGPAGHGDHHDGGAGGSGAGAPGLMGGPDQGTGQGQSQGQIPGQGEWKPGNDWPAWFTSEAGHCRVSEATLAVAVIAWVFFFLV